MKKLYVSIALKLSILIITSNLSACEGEDLTSGGLVPNSDVENPDS